MTTPNVTQLRIKYREIKNSADSRKLQIDVWLQGILIATGKSQYEMETFLSQPLGRGKADRVRYLKNIASGYKPSRIHPQRTLDIVEVLHKEYGYEEIKNWLCSPFWHVISSKFSDYASNPGAIRLILAEAIEIARSNDISKDVRGDRYFEFEEPLRFGRRPAMKKFKIPVFLLGPANFDQLAVLALMYREAYIGCAIGYAMQIRSLFLQRFEELLRHPFIDSTLKEALFDLTIKRVLSPIRQLRRNAAKDLESSYKSFTRPNERSDVIMSFLRSHDKTLKHP